MKKTACISLTTILLLSYSTAFTWNETKTHPRITQQATDNSSLNQYLQTQLKIEDGIDHIIIDKDVVKWLREGTKEEDDPACRASNHFHNPYLEWQYAGLTDTWWLADLWCWGLGLGEYPSGNIRSNLTWATGQVSDTLYDTESLSLNEWDWVNARQYFYAYLTGRNLMGDLIAIDQAQRNTYLAKTFQSLGQVMHLLQDVAVPAHVRDDFSQGHTMISPGPDMPWYWIGNGFEKYVERNDTLRPDWFIPPSVPPYFDDASVTDLWDTDQLTASFAPTNQWGLGLAEYASMNFLSEYSMFDVFFPYPMPEHCNIVALPPIDVQTPLNRQYLASQNGHPGEQIEHLAVVSYVKHYAEVYLPNVSSEMVPLWFDSTCYNDYAEKLVPKAVGYSTALLDYFFRGQMTVQSFPFFYNNQLYGLRLKITNASPTLETMTGGGFILTLRYTPEGAADDGSEDFFVTAYGNTLVNELAYDEEMEVFFTPDTISIPSDCWHTVSCMLTYSGMLGNEPNAVAAKAFTPGTPLFREEWDNGLTGNYPWASTLPEDNYDNGISLVNVANGLLTMENYRIADDDRARTNYVSFDFTADDPLGLLISPDTFIQFIIYEMSNVPENPNAGHVVLMRFNNQMALQFSVDGPFIEWSGATALVAFTPGSIYYDNIYGIFESAGIPVTEPLYLRDITFEQQIFNNYSPDQPDETDMIMVVDSICLVEEKIEE